MQKERLDVMLAERSLVESRSLAQKLIMAGQVRVEGQVVLKPSLRFPLDALLEVIEGPRFVSRGGEKLEPALLAFGLGDLSRQLCADVGSSTGGFTDCLLQHGASRVYALDVGYGVLHWKLRSDPRVISMERTNARHVEHLPEPVTLVTVDASFISLKTFLPVIVNWFPPSGGQIIALIKPQFEAGRVEAARGEGVIRDPRIHRRVLEGVLEFSARQGLSAMGLIRSPLLGPKGNTEFLVHLAYPGNSQQDFMLLIDHVFTL
jgi:23S rRNA (cytidine1920-2'-O)/16S rRNA (cytidine1409-2'-O)-methyltransferase